MSLLRDIQTDLLDKNADLATILLKVRVLAARLGNEPLEDWVKYEADGYPAETEVPGYRVVGVTFTALGLAPGGRG